MYTIKESPNDFIVDEVMDMPWSDEKNKYIIFSLKKTNKNTIQVVDMLTKTLRLKPRDIGFGGIKDKVAITTQYISFPYIEGKCTREVIENIDSIPNVELSFIGYFHKSVNPSMIQGNRFKLTITGIENYTFTPQEKMINYFGEQRFSKNNAQIGRSLVKKNFKEAIQHMLMYSIPNIEAIMESQTYNSVDQSKCTYTEKQIVQSFLKDPNDYIGALRKLPKSALTLQIHALQSELWNKCASRLLKSTNGELNEKLHAKFVNEIPKLPEKIPAIGFFYDEDDWEQSVQDVIETLLDEENLTPRDFVIKQMHEITEPGAVRQTVVDIKNVRVHEKTESKLVLEFELPRGSYATITLRHMLKQN